MEISNQSILEFKLCKWKHAVIEVTNTEVYVTDNNSRNFTYINGNRLFPNNKNILVDGDELTLADQKFEVSICR